jgi:hypothetical protein
MTITTPTSAGYRQLRPPGGHMTPPVYNQPDYYWPLLQQLTYYPLYSPYYPRRPGEPQTAIDERELRELIRTTSPAAPTGKKPVPRSRTPAQPQGEDSFTKFETEQRKRPVVETEVPPFNLGAIPSEKAADSATTPAVAAPTSDNAPPSAIPESTDSSKAPERRPTPAGAGWSASSLGLLAIVAVLGALIFAVSVWYIGRGVYDRLEYR